MSQFRLTPQKFKERITLIYEFNKAVEQMCYHLKNRLKQIDIKDRHKEYDYVLTLFGQLVLLSNSLSVLSTQVARKTTKIEIKEIEMQLLIAKIKYYFETHP